MQRIKKLSSIEAQKIAAGEVVERPANIVKELVENSLDAGATSISISIKRGGHKEICIIDNGCGMSYEDAYLCFEHHATSKITSLNDLYSLKSFGFRGEALSSIAAVSNITLQTKEAEAELGLKIKRTPEEIIKQESIGSNAGTSITISDIFFNVPARQKFLKKPETEWRQIVNFFQSMCLAHQSVHFKLFHEGSLIYNAPPTTSLADRFAQIASLNTGSLLDLEPISRSGITLSGVISDAHTARYNKNHMFFFVNSRWVKNYKLAQAVLKGYSGSLPTNKFPLCAIMIEVDPSQVDVNIHPRKEEVQFLYPQHVQILITEQTAKMLQRKVSTDLETSKHYKSSRDNKTFAPSTLSKPFDQPFSQVSKRVNKSIPPSSLLTTPKQIPSLQLDSQRSAKINNDERTQQQTTIQPTDYYVIGVAHKTYIMLEHKDGILFVDQHAAHERILLERFSKESTIETIPLICPILINFSENEIRSMEHMKAMLLPHGIDIRIMSDNQVGVVSTPLFAKNVDWNSFLHELLEQFEQENKNELLQSPRSKILAGLACKAAVKAGDTLTTTQIFQLLHDLEQCKYNNICAHGRPTSWLLQEYDIKKKFKRDYR